MSLINARILTGKEEASCPTCGSVIVTKLDAIGRTRHRCPRCDRVSPPQHIQPDEVHAPQTLARSKRAAALPPIREGQLRCQRCAVGVEKTHRFCPACSLKRKPKGFRTLLPRKTSAHCETCGVSVPYSGMGRPRHWCEKHTPPRHAVRHVNESHERIEGCR